MRAGDQMIVLTGFMGTGKSTVGRRLADHLGWDFVDTDHLIEARHGPIPAIFSQDGEAAFRDIEATIASEVAMRRRTVVATGGGMMLDRRNISSLGRSAPVVCLTARPAEVLRRVETDDAERPLLAQRDPAAAIARLLASRADGYARFPQIATTGRSPDDIAIEILNVLELEPVTLEIGHDAGTTPYVIGVGLLRSENAEGSAALVSDRSTNDLHGPLLGPMQATLLLAKDRDLERQVPKVSDERWTGTGTTGLIALGGRSVQAGAAWFESMLASGPPLSAIPTTLPAMAELATGDAAAPAARVVADVVTLQTLGRRPFAMGMADLAMRGHVTDARIMNLVETGASAGEIIQAPGGVNAMVQLMTRVVESITTR